MFTKQDWVHFWVGFIFQAVVAMCHVVVGTMTFCKHVSHALKWVWDWILDHRYRHTQVSVSIRDLSLAISFREHPSRKVLEYSARLIGPWSPECRYLGATLIKDSWPSRTATFSWCIPYLIGWTSTAKYTKRWWDAVYGPGEPKHVTTHGLTITDRYITLINGTLMNERSREIDWRRKLKGLFVKVENSAPEETGNYSGIIPIPRSGKYSDETIRMTCKRMRLTRTIKTLFRTRVEVEDMYSIDVPDGVLVPSDYNVCDEILLTGTTIVGVKGHVEAMARYVETIVSARSQGALRAG